jgi:hypothetical protein
VDTKSEISAHNGGVTLARAQSSPRSPDLGLLCGNLLAGACWLAALVALNAWPLAVIGAAYVLAGSVYLAYFPRPWLVPWLAAAGLWVWLIGSIAFENTATHYAASLVAGACIGGLCFAAWQALAAALALALSALPMQRT